MEIVTSKNPIKNTVKLSKANQDEIKKNISLFKPKKETTFSCSNEINDTNETNEKKKERENGEIELEIERFDLIEKLENSEINEEKNEEKNVEKKEEIKEEQKLYKKTEKKTDKKLEKIEIKENFPIKIDKAPKFKEDSEDYFEFHNPVPNINLLHIPNILNSKVNNSILCNLFYY